MSLDGKIDELANRFIGIVSKEPMSFAERFAKVSSFQEPDRLPFLAQIHDHAAKLAGIKVGEIFRDPKKMLYSQLLTALKYGFDCVYVLYDVFNIEAEALGAKMFYPEDGIPVIAEPLIKEQKDLEKLSIPDPRKDGRMPYVVEVNRLVSEKLGEYRWYNFPVCSPTTLAIQLRGYFNFIKDMRENPDFVHKMLDFCEEVIEHYVRFLQEEISPDPPSMASAWEVVPNFSPRMFREFIYPHTANVIKRMGGGAWVGGGFPISPMPNWESFIRESIATTHTSLLTIIMLESDWYDLRTLKRISDDTRTPFILGVRAGLISGGTNEDIRAFVKKAIVEMAPGGGCFVFGDQIPQDTDPRNVQCLVDSVKRFGRFPIRT